MRDGLVRALLAGLLLTGSAAVAQEQQDAPGDLAPAEKTAEDVPTKEAKGLAGITIEGLWYLSYQDGQQAAGTTGETDPYSQFRLKRGYLTFKKELAPWLEGRFTPDIHQDSTGEYKLRVKYLYAKLKAPGSGFFARPYAEVGMVHMPWLDFEEHVDYYRMQDTMFMERCGLFNSADMGVLVGSNLGPDLPEEYRKTVSGHYPGRHGSWQAGVFNGGGYAASEKNDDKVFEARVTYRPLPDHLPGLQVSGLYVNGKGNVAEPEPGQPFPDWVVRAAMVSFESPHWVVTGQVWDGEGNQAGSAVRTSGPHQGESLPQDGFSFFTEVRFPASRRWSVIGRYDSFDPDSDDPASDLQERTILGVAYALLGNRSTVVLLDYEQLDHRAAGIPKEDRVQLTLQVAW